MSRASVIGPLLDPSRARAPEKLAAARPRPRVGAIPHPARPDDRRIAWIWQLSKAPSSGTATQASSLRIGVLRHRAKAGWVLEAKGDFAIDASVQAGGTPACAASNVVAAWWWDQTPYELGALGRAFGLRVRTSGMYSGGGWMQERLALFVARNGQLVQVLETPVRYQAVISGNIRRDGSRRPHFIDQDAVLRVTRGQGIPRIDKTLRGAPGKKQRFTWNATTSRYETKMPNIVKDETTP